MEIETKIESLKRIDFNYFDKELPEVIEIRVDYHLAQILAQRNRPVYVKTIKLGERETSFFAVKMFRQEYIDFISTRCL